MYIYYDTHMYLYIHIHQYTYVYMYISIDVHTYCLRHPTTTLSKWKYTLRSLASSFRKSLWSTIKVRQPSAMNTT